MWSKKVFSFRNQQKRVMLAGRQAGRVFTIMSDDTDYFNQNDNFLSLFYFLKDLTTIMFDAGKKMFGFDG